MDIIYGQGHSYGLYWLEQVGTPDQRTFTCHTIDESFSQSHALKLADLDGVGSTYLITGKRYRGHNATTQAPTIPTSSMPIRSTAMRHSPASHFFRTALQA